MRPAIASAIVDVKASTRLRQDVVACPTGPPQNY
jgi:hypothetical protein